MNPTAPNASTAPRNSSTPAGCFEIRSADGTLLRGTRRSVDGARAALAIVPGYADHAGRYAEVAEFLGARGIETFAIDLRGHGRSEGTRGHVARWDEYLDDVDALLRHARESVGDLPLHLHGHSMGGLVALTHALERGARDADLGLRAASVSSPFLGVALPVPAWKSALGRVVSRVVPAFAMPSGIDPGLLSRDPEVGRAYARDPLVFRTATARWFTEAMAAIARAEAGAGRIRRPTLVVQAGDDRIADPRAARPLFDRLGSERKRYVEYPGMYHEILNEIGREAPLGEIARWILEEVGGDCSREA